MSNRMVDAAIRYYEAGLSPVPLRRNTKVPMASLRCVASVRLSRRDIPTLFEDANVGIVLGAVSCNLVVIDCDTEESFAEIRDQIADLNLPHPPWIRSSERGGQIWLCCSEGVVAGQSSKTVQVLSRGCQAMAPPSRHPNGKEVTWLDGSGDRPPDVSIAHLSNLRFTNENNEVQSLGIRLIRRAGRADHDGFSLTMPAMQVLVHKDVSHYGGDNSAAEYGVCRSLLLSGFDPDYIRLVFEHYLPPHYTKVGWVQFERSILRKAVDRGGKVSRRLVPKATSWSMCLMDDGQTDRIGWTWRTGPTDRSVYYALQRRRQMSGDDVFRASCREVAELAGVTCVTAHTAIRRLIARGLLVKEQNEGSSDVRAAYCYFFPVTLPESLLLPQWDGRGHVNRRDKLETLGNTAPGAFAPSVSSLPLSPNHDVWHRDALGKVSWHLYTALIGHGPASTSELSARLALSPKKARTALRKLAAVGLCTYDGTNWKGVEAEVNHLDQLAVQLGTDGFHGRRVARHREDRERYASYQFAKAQRKGAHCVRDNE